MAFFWRFTKNPVAFDFGESENSRNVHKFPGISRDFPGICAHFGVHFPEFSRGRKMAIKEMEEGGLGSTFWKR